MQIEFDQKLNMIDRLYQQAQSLSKNYAAWRDTGWQQEGREACLKSLAQIEEYAAQADIALNETIDSLAHVFSEETQGQVLLALGDILFSLEQKIKKMYLACMHDEGSYRQVLLENYFQTDCKKNALLLYLVYPFLFHGVSPGHTNQVEARALAELLRDRGYNVDIANSRFAGRADTAKYQLVLGFGTYFEQFCSMRTGAYFVCYLTESSPYFANPAELKRLCDFEKRNHVRLPFERQSGYFLNLPMLSCADAAICIGSQQTVSTYEGMFRRIFPINATGFCGNFILEENGKARDCSRHFMWYGGAGPVHKGLDLCLEAFRMLPDISLHIVGEVSSEFYDFYRSDLEEGKNIFYYGFLGKDSEEFKQACRQCGFCISPSCSEGQSTSVITAMLAGMIPVCTPQTGLDMDRCGGEWINDIRVPAIAELIKTLAEIKEEELYRRQEAVSRYALSNHSIEHYREQLDLIFGKLNL